MKLIYNRKPTKEEIDRLQEIRESKYFYYDNNNKKTTCYENVSI